MECVRTLPQTSCQCTRHMSCHAGTCVAMQAHVLPWASRRFRHATRGVLNRPAAQPCCAHCCDCALLSRVRSRSVELRTPDATLGNRGGPVPLQARHCSTSTCATHTAPGIPFLRRIRQSGGNLRLLHRTVPSGCCLTVAWQSTLEVLGPGFETPCFRKGAVKRCNYM